MLTTRDIEDARRRIAGEVVRTPLLRLPALDGALGCRVHVKAECLQATGSFKLRGAMNRLLKLDADELAQGVVAASSGNHGRAIAHAARQLGTKATVVVPDTAAAVKVEGIRAAGTQVVLCDVNERFEVAAGIAAETGAVYVPPFDDEDVMAGQGTVGLEIAEQLPDVDAVVAPVSGGGLLGGLSLALKATLPGVRVYGAEPAALPRYSESLRAGRRVQVERHATVADALVSVEPGERCFPVVQANVDAVVPVEDADALAGMRLLLGEGKLLAEPSSCMALGAVLGGSLRFGSDEKVCFVLSGGNVGLDRLPSLLME